MSAQAQAEAETEQVLEDEAGMAGPVPIAKLEACTIACMHCTCSDD